MPSVVWADITMGFIKVFPKVGGEYVILTMVDRFSNYTHFIPIGHAYMVTMVVCAFFFEIVRLHSIPVSIMNNHNPTFTGNSW